jgi:hypothetical protein
MLFDRLSLHAVLVEANRPIDVFLDTKIIAVGDDLRRVFSTALVSSTVIVPIASKDALSAMMTHDATKIDNVLLEWILCLCALKFGRIKKVIPILIGCRDPTTNAGSTGITISGIKPISSDFFRESSVNTLATSKLVPTSTLREAARLLLLGASFSSTEVEMLDLGSWTLGTVISGMTGFLGIKTWEFFSLRRLVADIADNVQSAVNHEASLAALVQKRKSMEVTVVPTAKMTEHTVAMSTDATPKTTPGSEIAGADAALLHFAEAFKILQDPSKATKIGKDSLAQLIEDEGVEEASDLQHATVDFFNNAIALLKAVPRKKFITELEKARIAAGSGVDSGAT